MTRSGEAVMTRLRLKLLETSEYEYIIAAKAGISPSCLSRYAMGRAQIRPEHLMSLCEVLDCEPEDIRGDVTVG